MATPLIQRLEADRIDCQRVAQNYKAMTAPTEHLQRLIMQKEIKFNNPLLRWMFGNVRLKYQLGGTDRMMVTKETKAKKIDGVVALIMAVAAELTIKPKKSFKDIYG